MSFRVLRLIRNARRFYATAASSAESPVPRKPRTRKPKEPKKPKEIPKTTLEHSVVHEHLKQLADQHKANPWPSMDELESCKPLRPARETSRAYEDQYTELVDTLLRKFSSEQLRYFARQYKLDVKFIKTKDEFARVIIEQAWLWVSLTEVQKLRFDRTVQTTRGSSFLRYLYTRLAL